MEIKPILAALQRHRTAAIIVALEIALSCAILCNAVFMIVDRLSAMKLPSGLAEDQLVFLSIGAYRGKGDDGDAIVKQQLAALRAIPGVRSVDAVSAMPLSRNEWNTDISLKPDDKTPAAVVNEFIGTPGVVETMGLKLVEGRGFTADDAGDMQSFLPTAPVAVLPLALARKLWPGQDALGKDFYSGPHRYRVVGIVEHLLAAGIRSPAEADYTALFPVRAGKDIGGSYLLRTSPQDRDRVLREAADALLKVSPNGIVTEQQRFDETRAAYFRQDRSMAGLLIGVCALLLIITALGIVGLASFWVQSRTRQIGIRRALGARRIDILRYFQTENFLIVGIGIVLGMALAYGINLWLMRHYELSRLPALYLPAGALALWLTGQLAVFGPALRASKVPPVVATRSV